MFEGICDILHREMEMFEEKYSDGKTTMVPQDLAHIDTIAHALKCLATYEAMKGAEYRSKSRYDYGYRRY